LQCSEIPRFAGRDEQIREFVTDLVRRKVAVIVVTGVRESIAAKEATATIPIVMIVNPDPIGMGLVRSLAHPGGNVTGLTTMDWDIYGKRIEILKQAVPDLRKAALLLSSGNPVYRRGSAWAAKVIADSSLLGVDLSIAETGSNNIDAAIASANASGAQCLVGASDGVVLGNAKDIAEIAMKYRLPTIFAFRQNVELGGLMMYGARLTDLSRRAAYFVDRILKGADPGDMPIEQPTKFDFIINLKTAKALSLEIPPSLLARADEVIE